MPIFSPSRTRVAVLRGGPSYGYNHSLDTGKHVLEVLRDMPELYEPVDIFISRDGEWHLNGVVHEPAKALRYANVVYNALHGEYGEDGQVQNLLDTLQVPYTGSGAFSSALSLNKELAKKSFDLHLLPTPKHELLDQESLTEEQIITIFRTYMHPVVVKPTNKSIGLGVKIAHTYHELLNAIEQAFEHSEKVMVEEFIRGKTAACAVVEKARGEQLYALVPIELLEDSHIYPGSFTPSQNKLIENMAKKAHTALGMRHYSVSDFVITPRGKIYILETNSLPNLHRDSLMHKSLSAVGFQEKDFLDHVIKLALGQL